MARFAALMFLAAAVVGCSAAPIGPVVIQTQAPTNICAAARVSGTLVYDLTYGLAYTGDGDTHAVIWPNGYSAAREDDGVVVLIDPSGRIVAREGDRIVSAGAYGGNNVGYPCGDLRVNPPST